jgi:hypothetical protein
MALRHCGNCLYAYPAEWDEGQDKVRCSVDPPTVFLDSTGNWVPKDPHCVRTRPACRLWMIQPNPSSDNVEGASLAPNMEAQCL